MARSPRRGTTRRAPAPTDVAERELLRIAREVDTRTRQSDENAAETVGFVARACADGTLAIARLAAGLESQRDETRALALGWAREQLRLALETLLLREATAGRLRSDVSPAALSRVLLAGCEAMAHEPPSDIAERVDTLLQVLRR